MKNWFKRAFYLLFNSQYDLAIQDCLKDVKTRQTGLGGYRVDAPITDWDEVEKELDMAKKIVKNENKTLIKDEIFRQALLVLLKSVEVKTVKIDKLIEELEKMG